MPNYGIAQAGSLTTTPTLGTGQGAAPQPGGFNIVCLNPGDQYFLFNAESPSAPQASVAVNRGVGPLLTPAGITFTIKFAAAPTDSLVIQASNTDIDSDYQTVYTSTNKQFDFYADLGEFAYYRAKLVSQSAGGAVTVIAQR